MWTLCSTEEAEISSDSKISQFLTFLIVFSWWIILSSRGSSATLYTHRNKELWTEPHFIATKKLFCLRQNGFVKTNSYVTVENRKKPGQRIAKCPAKCSHYIPFLWVQYCKVHPQAVGLLCTILRGVLLESMGLLFLEVMTRKLVRRWHLHLPPNCLHIGNRGKLSSC